jgi:predicted mannosyl-3-phosphoglycerate phosphatase (HAD superfamily)
LRQTTSVVYLLIDQLIPSRGNLLEGLEEFLTALDRAGIPCVWLTSRTRLQIDDARRRMNHAHPFIAEDGCGVYLPEDYFHLRPQATRGQNQGPETLRLGRFTCIPIAEQPPAAAEALEELSTETGVSVVPLRSLSPRELAQNSGLRRREAELARHRDFDELFFFAGASSDQVRVFEAAARDRNVQLRPQGPVWSLAVGSSAGKCIRALSKLYDRALHAHARVVGIAVSNDPQDFFAACDRAVLLSRAATKEGAKEKNTSRVRVLKVPLSSPQKWEQLAKSLGVQM